MPSFAPVVLFWKCLGAKRRFIKERFKLTENLRAQVLAARMTELITARARKNKLTARMLSKTIRYPFFGSIPPRYSETFGYAYSYGYAYSSARSHLTLIHKHKN